MKVNRLEANKHPWRTPEPSHGCSHGYSTIYESIHGVEHGTVWYEGKAVATGASSTLYRAEYSSAQYC